MGSSTRCNRVGTCTRSRSSTAEPGWRPAARGCGSRPGAILAGCPHHKRRGRHPIQLMATLANNPVRGYTKRTQRLMFENNHGLNSGTVTQMGQPIELERSFSPVYTFLVCAARPGVYPVESSSFKDKDQITAQELRCSHFTKELPIWQ